MDCNDMLVVYNDFVGTRDMMKFTSVMDNHYLKFKYLYILLKRSNVENLKSVTCDKQDHNTLTCVFTFNNASNKKKFAKNMIHIVGDSPFDVIWDEDINPIMIVDIYLKCKEEQLNVRI